MQQLYVTFREQFDSSLIEEKYVRVEKTPLGYAAIYNPASEKCVKKNKAQDEWAGYKLNSSGEYVEHVNHRHVWPDGAIYKYDERYREGFMLPGLRPGSFTKAPDLKQIYDEVLIADNLKPRIVDNVYREGFKIVDTVTRYSTSNKLWRILDPYGFELEISTANMEQIMMDGIIDHGEIIGECIWDFGKNGIGKATLLRK